MSINIFLQVLALVLLVLAALKTAEPPRCSFGWTGVAILVLTLILGGLRL
jgi:hypothetical protein